MTRNTVAVVTPFGEPMDLQCKPAAPHLRALQAARLARIRRTAAAPGLAPGAALLLIAASLAASYLPVRRATRLDAVAMLRN
jgi:hypothetical protein